jgi:hypothetical protein
VQTDGTPLVGVHDTSGRGRVHDACQEIAAKYGSAIEAVARNPYYTRDQRAAMIAGLRAQQKAEIAAVRKRIQYEERQKMKAGRLLRPK